MKHRFKSLPDGRRVFWSSYPWTGYYVVPGSSSEHQLYRITLWEFFFSFLSLFIIGGGGLWFLKNFPGRYSGSLVILTFFFVSAVIRWALYRNDLHNLIKIDYRLAVSSFYSDLSQKLRYQLNNSLPNFDISVLLDIPNSDDKIIMLKYTESFPNILRSRLDGSVVWQAEIPATDDVYTNIEWKGHKLHAFSRLCKSVLLDEQTGKIISAT